MNTSVNLIASSLEQSKLTDEASTANISRLSCLAWQGPSLASLVLKHFTSKRHTCSRQQRHLKKVTFAFWKRIKTCFTVLWLARLSHRVNHLIRTHLSSNFYLLPQPNLPMPMPFNIQGMLWYSPGQHKPQQWGLPFLVLYHWEILTRL